MDKLPKFILDLKAKLKPNHRFLFINYDTENTSGLFDQSTQLKYYIRIAFVLNLKLITPNTFLDPLHNNGKKMQYKFSDYYDINSITVGKVNVELIENTEVINQNEIYVMDRLTYEQLNNLTKEFNFGVDIVNFNYHEKYEEYAKQLIHKNDIQGCIHIRRGDRLKSPCFGASGLEWDLATRPQSVLKLLKETDAPSNIYIMTDMKPTDPTLLEYKKITKYNFMCLYDFDDLNNIRKDNNYIAYTIELAIAKFAKYKKTKKDVIVYYKEH